MNFKIPKKIDKYVNIINIKGITLAKDALNSFINNQIRINEKGNNEKTNERTRNIKKEENKNIVNLELFYNNNTKKKVL